MNERNPDKLFIHKSGLSAWRQCPRKFYWMYLKPQDPAMTEESIAMEHGATFHDVARRFTYLYDVDVLFSYPTWMDRLKYLSGCIPVGLTKTIWDWMQNLADFEARRSLGWKLDRSMFKPVVMEKYLESEEFGYAGTLDRIDHYDETSYVVIDYKPRIYNLSSLRQEQAIYWVLANDQLKLDKPVNYWGVIAYDEGIYRTEEFKKVTFTALRKNTAYLQTDIDKYKKEPSEELFPLKVGEYCDWCGFLSICYQDPKYVEIALGGGKDGEEADIGE